MTKFSYGLSDCGWADVHPVETTNNIDYTHIVMMKAIVTICPPTFELMCVTGVVNQKVGLQPFVWGARTLGVIASTPIHFSS